MASADLATAERCFRLVTDTADDKICRAAALAGLALCDGDITLRRDALRQAESEFTALDYFRGAMMCDKLATRDVIDVRSFEFPDALL